MLYAKRIIPVLQLADRKLVKTEKFIPVRYLGDPLNAVRIFNLKQAQELIILDINASHTKVINFQYLAKITAEAFVPLSYGGGISSIEQVHQLYQIGFDRVILNTAIIEQPELISEIAAIYGTQSVICAIEVERGKDGGLQVKYASGTKLLANASLDALIHKIIALGAGELFIYSKDRDGTYAGLDHELISLVAKVSSIPVIAGGGANSRADIEQALVSGASAVAVGSMFSFYGPHKAVLINYEIHE